MKQFTKAILIPATLVVGFFSGCSSYGPNTQRGAVGGAALGALAGAIIGNNSGSGNAASGALIGAAAGGLAGGTLGNAADRERGSTYDRQPPVVYANEPEAATQVVITTPPPPPPPMVREEVIVARSRPDAVWVEGYWDYSPRVRGYVWVPGHWEVPPPSYRHYVAPHWVRRGHSHVYVRGYWRG
ncbi:glycine zipper domain-containing protein [Oleiharenicola lentus]|uniref:glycine zipper domain-containing protein n=1 Tax=Oleiharenicola lentus TaxID=2508720 RepID=UPI003F664631